MTRYNDAIQTISAEDPEEKPMSSMDMVRKFLTGAAAATAASYAFGTPGAKAVGDVMDRAEAAKKQRKLDKVTRAKNILAAEQVASGIKANEATAANSADIIKNRAEELRLRGVDAETKRTEAQERISRDKIEQARKASEMTLKAFGFGGFAPKTGRPASAGKPATGRGGYEGGRANISMPPVSPQAKPPRVDEEAMKKEEVRQAVKRQEWAADLARMLRSTAGIKSAQDLQMAWPQLLNTRELQGLRPDEQEWIYAALNHELASPEQEAKYRAMRENGGLEADPNLTMTEEIATRIPNAGPTAAGSAIGGFFGSALGPVGTAAGATFGGAVGNAAGRVMDPDRSMLERISGRLAKYVPSKKTTGPASVPAFAFKR